MRACGSWFISLSTLFCLAACSSDRAGASRSGLDAATDLGAKKAWISKLARTLRYNGPLSAVDDIDQLADLPRETIVDQFMADPRFIDTVLDFNLYFLGLKPATLYQNTYVGTTGTEVIYDRRYDEAAFSAPQAMAAAKAVLSGGDYFSLFDLNQAYFAANSNQGYPVSGGPNPDASATPKDKRSFYIGQAAATHDKITALFAAPAAGVAFDIAGVCSKSNDQINTVSENLDAAGIDGLLVVSIIEGLYFNLEIDCFFNQAVIDRVATQQFLGQSRAMFDKLYPLVEQLAYETYHIRAIADVATLSQDQLGLSAANSSLTVGGLWSTLNNSSTNHNRKRAAYVLKTYFCDDLTPLNIAVPASHTGNKHADDPACQACHYKLDPMAGFFRYRGAAGINFAGRKNFLFDDQTRLNEAQMQNYFNTWKAPQGATHAWNIGYIRSPKPTQENLNFYGNDLPDLFAYFRSKDAPEVRQCLTRRMTDYFLGKGQAFSGDWVQTMTQEFDNAIANDPAHSATAFRKVVKELVLSNTFATRDPAPNQCYDFAPGHQQSSLPCEVSYIIEKSCTNSCHKPSNESGGLDLTVWISLPNGQGTFKHLGDNGQQIPRVETFQRLSERLSTNDPDLLMPRNRHMDDTDRAAFYKWVDIQAAATQ